jgi:hypothetical protein
MGTLLFTGASGEISEIEKLTGIASAPARHGPLRVPRPARAVGHQ